MHIIVGPNSSELFYIVAYYMKRFTTSWIDGILFLMRFRLNEEINMVRILDDSSGHVIVRACVKENIYYKINIKFETVNVKRGL